MADKSLVLHFILCPRGYCCSNTTCQWNASCSAGRDKTVPLCGKCLPLYSEAFGSNQCVPRTECGSAIAWGMLALCCVLLLIYVVKQMFLSPLPSFGVMKSVLYFMQAVDLLIVGASSKTTLIHQFAVSISNMSTNAIGSFTGAGVCLFDMGAEVKLMSGYVTAAALFASLLMLFGLKEIIVWCHRKFKRHTSVETVQMEDLLVIPEDSKTNQESTRPHDRFWTAAVSLVLSTYSIVAKTTLQLVHCRSVPALQGQSTWVLFRAGEFQCYDNWFQIIAFALFLPIVCVLPLLVFLWTKRKLKAQDGAQYGGPLRLVVVCYTGECWYWECIMMFRRLVMAMLWALIPDPFWRALSLCVTCCVVLVINISLHPFATWMTHRVETATLSLLCVQSMLSIRDSVYFSLGQPLSDMAIEALEAVIIIVVLFIGFAYVFQRVWFKFSGLVIGVIASRRRRDVSVSREPLLAEGLTVDERDDAALD